MKHSTLAVAASLGALILLMALYACSPPGHDMASVELGKTTFSEYCASCHGDQAKGDGPLAADIDGGVPDLTTLKSQYDGVFPSELVLRTVDGRQEFLAHGTRTMPIWGNIWRPGEEDTHADEVEAQRLMNGLLNYLESVQGP